MQIETLQLGNYRLFRQAQLVDLARMAVVLADAFGDGHLRKLGAKEMFRHADEIAKPSTEPGEPSQVFIKGVEILAQQLASRR